MAFLPIDAAKACIRRSRRYIALAENDIPDGKIKNDLRRSALVMAVAAIDSYMHWMVTRRISEIRRSGDLPKSLKKFSIPFSDLASLADSAISAQQRNKKARPWVKVKKAIQKELLRETFQSFEQVGDAFALAGINKGWSSVATGLNVESDEIKKKLNHLGQRRNHIVHEGDITRASRPQKLKYNEIEHESVKETVDWIEMLLKAIDKVVDQSIKDAKVQQTPPTNAPKTRAAET